MSDIRAGIDHQSAKNGKEDIDSKIADFMADIDEIVLGKKSNPHSHQEDSEWKQCFDETSQAIYYWNSKTNECSWDPPATTSTNHHAENSLTTAAVDGESKKRRGSPSKNLNSPKKLKKPSLIAEYTSSESESSEGDDDNDDEEEDIDELLEEVLDKDEKIDKNKLPPVDLYPRFEADCQAAIARLADLGDTTAEIFALRIQLETRLEDWLAGHLSKAYAASKLEEALGQIEELEKLYLTTITPMPAMAEPVKPSLTSSEMALLLSLPPPPPPPSPPPPPIFPQPLSNQDDPTLQLFYAQLHHDQSEPPPIATKAEQHHAHHHQHKDKKSKPAKTLPTDLIQKWAHARQELRGITDVDDS